jgi:hypothetical protein
MYMGLVSKFTHSSSGHMHPSFLLGEGFFECTRDQSFRPLLKLIKAVVKDSQYKSGRHRQELSVSDTKD